MRPEEIKTTGTNEGKVAARGEVSHRAVRKVGMSGTEMARVWV
jgi:hypothetical protein